jgi:hypothetical protein
MYPKGLKEIQKFILLTPWKSGQLPVFRTGFLFNSFSRSLSSVGDTVGRRTDFVVVFVLFKVSVERLSADLAAFTRPATTGFLESMTVFSTTFCMVTSFTGALFDASMTVLSIAFARFKSAFPTTFLGSTVETGASLLAGEPSLPVVLSPELSVFFLSKLLTFGSARGTSRLIVAEASDGIVADSAFLTGLVVAIETPGCLGDASGNAQHPSFWLAFRPSAS